MKRLIPAVLWALLCMTAQAEQSYNIATTLTGDRNHYYVANNHITLTPGFQAEPKNGCEVVLAIDPYGVFPPASGIIGGPSPNDNGVVGAIGGDIDVGLLGSAIYNIPIQLPDGLGGIKPQLSLCYNNQGRNGLMGWGWDLVGISSITRTGATRYHDGFISTVDYTHDRFCLDGMRLMNVSNKGYGAHGASYRTEQDQQNKIVSYNESGINGTSYFKVWTSDGKLLYYGNSSDSKALMDKQGHVNIWLLSKVEDSYGNTMEYHYLNTNDTYLLTSITYSANPKLGIDPAFTITFHYDKRDDIEISCIGNTVCRKCDLLKKITVMNGKEEMFHYRLEYQQPDPKAGYPYHLLTKIHFKAGEEHLNPTTIRWGDNNYPIHGTSDVQIPVVTNGIENAFNNAVKFTGDFNGDGHTDVIATKPNSAGQYAVADVFINKGCKGKLQFDYLTSFHLKDDISWIYTADFDGDGLDDIMFSNRNRDHYPLPDVLETDFYLSRVEHGTVGFHHYHALDCRVPNNMTETHLIGDFLGEGKCSVIIQSTGENSSYLECSLYITFDEQANDFKHQVFPEHLSSSHCYPSDFNGDGITEILYQEQGKTCLTRLQKEKGGCRYKALYTGKPYHWEDCFPGDYNGDGMIDALFYAPKDNHPWSIALSDKTGFNGLSFPLPKTFPYSSPGNYHFSLDVPNHTSHYLKVADLDGNGCSDLALFEDKQFYVFYGPLRPESATAPFAYSQKMSADVFHLYDNMSAAIGNFLGQENMAYLGGNTLSRIAPVTRRQEIQSITDGMGRITELHYDVLTPNPDRSSEDDFYQLLQDNWDYINKIYCTPIPVRALKSITTYNVKGKPVTTQCHYGGAMLHRQGKGFLGFSYTCQEDYCDNTLEQRTVRRYETVPMDNVIHMMMTEESLFDKNEVLLARSTYTNLLYLHQKNNKVFIPTFNKTVEEYDVDAPGVLLQKKIHETSVQNNCSSLYLYNECLGIASTAIGTTSNPNNQLASSCEFQEITHVTYLPNNSNSWLVNRMATSTSQQYQAGDDTDICHQKTYEYDANHPYKVISITDLPNDGSHPEDRLALKTEYQYDPVGNIKTQTISAPNDNLTSRTETYDYGTAYGRRLLTRHVNAMNQETVYHYDSLYNYCTSVTDCNGLTTRFTQDPLGTVCMTYYPDNTVACKALRWRGASHASWEKKTGQATKEQRYAKTGDLLQEISYDLNGEAVLIDYVYDNHGKVIKTTVPHQPDKTPAGTQYTYDSHHRITSITHADGSYETISYDGNLRSTRYHSLTGETQTQTKIVNAMGWTAQSTDADGNSIVYGYYPDGKPHWTQLDGHEETRIEMRYDALGNRISLSDPNYGLTTYEYNAFGELVSQQSPKMDKTDFFYDPLGNMVKRIETPRQGQQKEVTEWVYGEKKGEKGLLKSILSGNQVIQYEYDDFCRLKQLSERYQGDTYKTRYAYDKASRIASITYPSGYNVNYQYTSEGQLQHISNPETGLLWKALENTPSGQPERFVTGNGYVTRYGYDPNTQRLTSILTTRNGTAIQHYEYAYDEFSNMTRRTDVRYNVTEVFGYDALNRLTSVTDDHGVSTFSYDALGRMTEKTSPDGIVFTMADYTGPKPHAIKSAICEDNTFPSERMDISYTSFDKVATIDEGTNWVRFDYGYDHQRRKMTETTDGATRTKTYINSCEFIDNEDGSRIVRTFISGPTGVFAVAERTDESTSIHYVHKDHLGSWTTISDNKGVIEQECQFDAWGNVNSQAKLMFDRGFTGHEHLQGVHLINMNGRLYDPVTSSMLSPDNHIQLPDFSQNLNRYAYCLNNPLTYTDPDGNTFIEFAMLYLFLSCTDVGYELQKYTYFIAFHIDLHLSTQQIGFGLDVSIGIPKKYDISYRTHLGLSYYHRFYDNSYRGWEFRVGGEWCIAGCIDYSGTTFFQGKNQQTTNAITLGYYFCSATYENDYMFNIGKYLIGIPNADGGDRYRSAAVRLRLGPLYAGVNFFTGDPGLDKEDRRTYADADVGGRETYTINENGDDPDAYRAGIAYVGLGPFKIGTNSEKVRDRLQNHFAHDLICKGRSPYFKVLDRPAQTYFYFGTQTGGTLW